tara:strand:- start:244 stop:474 length:231 start_codon:yes stop_codon:yes gene_type:complete
MELISQYWHQIVFLIGMIIVAVRLKAEVTSLRKDVDVIQGRDTYVETVKHRAQLDVHEKQLTALWQFCNKLRDSLK